MRLLTYVKSIISQDTEMNKDGHKDGFKKQAGTSLTQYFHMSNS